MAEMEEIRLEALKGLTILAIHDDQFRRGAISDLEGTLGRYGVVLNEQEMERIRGAQAELESEGISTDEDLARWLNERSVLTEEEERALPPDEFIQLRWS